MPENEQDNEIPLPPPSGPGSIRGRRIINPRVMRDTHADARLLEARLERIDQQAAATAVPIKVHHKGDS